MPSPFPPVEPADPQEWFAFAESRARHFERIGGHYGNTMAENWRQEIKDARTLPHYFTKTNFTP